MDGKGGTVENLLFDFQIIASQTMTASYFNFDLVVAFDEEVFFYLLSDGDGTERTTFLEIQFISNYMNVILPFR